MCMHTYTHVAYVYVDADVYAYVYANLRVDVYLDIVVDVKVSSRKHAKLEIYSTEKYSCE